MITFMWFCLGVLFLTISVLIGVVIWWFIKYIPDYTEDLIEIYTDAAEQASEKFIEES